MAKVIESNKERIEDNCKLIWSEIDWNEVKSDVEQLRGRIYTATDKKDFKTVNNLQKLAIRSYYVKLYAIRQITMVNSGKNTPGIDGYVCLTNEEREELYLKIKDFSFSSFKSYHPCAVKRVEILKENGRTRPIGIPIIYDRIIQMLVKIALEPEFECKFHGNSFGFRPGRCCQDAIEVIKDTINNGKGDYILDADLTGCFDNINHASLLSKLFLFKPIVKKWLKAGVFINNKLCKTVKGTPQGGIISPLLTNIALNGLDYFFNRIVFYHGREYPITFVRYADDIVILTTDKYILNKIKERLSKILSIFGLSLNSDKTVLVHKSEGFKFLGFHLVSYPGRTLWVQPDKLSSKRILRKIKFLLDTHKQVKTDALVYALNRIILGWARYYQYCRIHGIFPRMGAVLFRWIWGWCKRRHPKKSKNWVKERYFKTVGNRSWVLSGDTWKLSQFSDIKRKVYKWRVGNRSYLNPLHRKVWKLDDLTYDKDINTSFFFS